MSVELVEAAMPDGLRLAGAWHLPPADAGPSPMALDALVMLHGTGSNFYSSSLWTGLIPKLLTWNLPVLAVNTRGHDSVASAKGMPQLRWIGSAYECVADCRLDVAGWIAHAANRGHARIGLLGHSLGAVKAIYSQAFEPNPAVRAVIAVSPPRLSHLFFSASPKSRQFLDDFERAQLLVAEGRGETLIEVGFPLPCLLTATSYIDKYGPDERYNVLSFASRVQVPVVFTYGTFEVQSGIAFRGMPEALEDLQQSGAKLDVQVVAGADHVYSTACDELATGLGRWARKRLPAAT